MKYYLMHEKVYQGLQKAGFISWDRRFELETIWSHQVNRFLMSFLNEIHEDLKGKFVLDLGTGTGNCALFCSREGANAVGVDISKTAIEMARANNEALMLKAEFFEADILELDLKKKFDIVTDSSLLHCLVGNDDRKAFYEIVKKHLKPNGHFYIHTMIESSSMDFDPQYFLMKDEILYSLGMNEIEERIEIDGKNYFPHRTILKKSHLLKEIDEAGFEIIVEKKTSEPNNPDCFIALLKMK